jgi:hypothetical protein
MLLINTFLPTFRPEALAIAQTPSPITDAKIGKVFHKKFGLIGRNEIGWGSRLN